MDKNSKAGSGVVGAFYMTWRAINTIVWDANQYGFYTYDGLASVTWENCVAFSGGTGFYVNNQATGVVNCAAFDNSTDFTGTLSAGIGRGNASADTTAQNANWSVGASNISSQSSASCFQSTTDTDANFLDISATGNLNGAGWQTPPIGRATDIRGRPATGPKGKCIGAAEAGQTQRFSSFYGRLRRT